MDQHDVRTFLTVADELHFGRAAERLRVSTAQVSRAVRKLERQVGAALFERTSRKVTLTPIGRRLRDDIAPADEAIRAGFDRATAAGRDVAGTLRVGFTTAAAGQFVLEAAKLFQERHPGGEVEIREIEPGFGTLRRDEVDVLFAPLPIDEADLTVGPVLVREDRMLAVSARHPFAGRTSISFADVARTAVLTASSETPAYFLEWLIPQHTRDGRPIDRGPTFTTVEEGLALIGAGKGTYPVPAGAARFYARPDLAYVPIHDASPYEWALIWRTTADTARIRAFQQAAQILERDRSDS